MSTLKKRTSAFHHGDLSSSLIQAGLIQVEKQGLNSLGLRQLALQTGVSPTAVYRHFRDLEHLKAEVSKASREYLGRMMQSQIEKVPQRSREIEIERLWASGMAYIEFGLYKPNLFEIAFVSFESPNYSEEDPSPWKILNGCLDDLQSVGLLSDELRKVAPMVAWSAVHGFAGLASQGFTGNKDATFKSANDVLGSVLTSLQIPQ